MFTQYKGKNMSLSVWLISAGVIGVCGFIFKKTVSNDAQNDFRLRDILTTDSPYEEEIQEESVRMISLLMAQRPIGPWICALIGGAQPYPVGGPLSHCVYKREVGAAGTSHEVRRQSSPH